MFNVHFPVSLLIPVPSDEPKFWLDLEVFVEPLSWISIERFIKAAKLSKDC
jgi:hypothetical protein